MELLAPFVLIAVMFLFAAIIVVDAAGPARPSSRRRRLRSTRRR